MMRTPACGASPFQRAGSRGEASPPEDSGPTDAKAPLRASVGDRLSASSEHDLVRHLEFGGNLRPSRAELIKDAVHDSGGQENLPVRDRHRRASHDRAIERLD